MTDTSALLATAADAIRDQVRLSFSPVTMRLLGSGQEVMLNHGEAETAAGAVFDALTAAGYSIVESRAGWAHHYWSTACEHAVHDGRPELHAECRLSCKYAADGVEPCRCPCHSGLAPGDFPPSWVDQARGLVLELLAFVDLTQRPELAERIAADRHLFWARGEVQPAGEWQAP